jgi:hypothetical protein
MKDGTMRIAGLVAALVLSGYAAVRPVAAGIPATTQPSVELFLWCAQFPDAVCRRQAAHTARARCRTIGRNARFVLSALLQRHVAQGDEGYFLYDCVR